MLIGLGLDFFARDLYTRTAVARLPFRQSTATLQKTKTKISYAVFLNQVILQLFCETDLLYSVTPWLQK